jgi:hypothetical protein
VAIRMVASNAGRWLRATKRLMLYDELLFTLDGECLYNSGG